MSRTFEFTTGSNFILDQLIYQNNNFYGVIRYTLSSSQHSMIYKKDSNFQGGGDVKFNAISLDPDGSSLAVGQSLSIDPGSTFLVFAGMVDDSSTLNGFIAEIGKSTF